MRNSIGDHVAGTTRLDMLFYKSCQLITPFFCNARGADRTNPNGGTGNQILIVTTPNLGNIPYSYSLLNWNNRTLATTHPKLCFTIPFPAVTKYRHRTGLQGKLSQPSSLLVTC